MVCVGLSENIINTTAKANHTTDILQTFRQQLLSSSVHSNHLLCIANFQKKTWKILGGPLGGQAKIWGGSGPPGPPLAPPLGQWLSFLWCYVICEMEKTIFPLPRLKFILNSIKNVHAPMKPQRVISQREVGSTLQRTIIELFFQEFCYETLKAYSKEVRECQKVSFLRRQIKPCLFFEVLFKALC